MQSPTTQLVDQAINNLSDTIVDDPKDIKVDNDTAKDDKTDGDKSGKDVEKTRDAEPARQQYDATGKRIETPKEDEKLKEEEKEGEFTADDALEYDAPDTPQTPTDNAGIQLSTSEQAFIRDNIGQPIVIQGYQGEGDDRKQVEIKAYSPNDIPSDFKFANDQQLAAATSGFQNLEQKANNLLGNYRQTQSNQVAQDFELRENEGVRSDIADMQKEGLFPKFTVRPGERGFDDSPEAKQIAEVLNIMTERNDMYLQQYNQGRPYKHIGFTEAYDMWEKASPERQASRKADTDQDAEDIARKERGSERSNSNRGMSSSNIVKPTVRSGTTTRDLLNSIDNDDF